MKTYKGWSNESTRIIARQFNINTKEDIKNIKEYLYGEIDTEEFRKIFDVKAVNFKELEDRFLKK